LSAGALLLGFDHPSLTEAATSQRPDPFAGGKLVGQLEFLNEGPVEMDTAFGSELDGRLFTSLSDLNEKNLVTPTERFYVRTRASKILPEPANWTIRVDGLVAAPRKLLISDVQASVKRLGLQLMECAGNTRAAHFGMISVGDWEGIRFSEILADAKPKSAATQVLVSGFDRYVGNSVTSTPGASWIFGLDELARSKAFLATQMNGRPLSRDHGAPVRLVVPGWYGCTCIKWVEQISLVDESAESTSQMLEYATRTQQIGSPAIAKDFLPARIDHAAMPVRVEKWQVGGKLRYRLVGILWGGAESVRTLGIRFNPEEEYVPVGALATPQTGPWTLWSHDWSPIAKGTYTIRLAITDPPAHPKRLESGYYARSVEITEV
jgi:DMSO/TMAO reductase YedYZ molybdopterin-dependent catalytic subunit